MLLIEINKRYEAYSKGDDFIRRYIFPGGHLPTVTQLVRSICEGSSGTLVVNDIENIGPHYAKHFDCGEKIFIEILKRKSNRHFSRSIRI